MIASHAVSCYPNGKVYERARGRYAPRKGIQDRLQQAAPVVEGRPGAGEFLRQIARPQRIDPSIETIVVSDRHRSRHGCGEAVFCCVDSIAAPRRNLAVRAGRVPVLV